MAEFTEVCRQALRMLRELSEGRGGKPSRMELYIAADGGVKLGNGLNAEIGTATAEDIEKIIMEWAAEHPEPVYPTWDEWNRANFPKAARPICMLNFTGRGACVKWDSCCECQKQRIPADIAEKLGIKPLEAKK